MRSTLVGTTPSCRAAETGGTPLPTRIEAVLAAGHGDLLVALGSACPCARAAGVAERRRVVLGQRHGGEAPPVYGSLPARTYR